MGTNYYIKTETETIHIGKHSCGWMFIFHKQPKLKNIKDLNNLLEIGTVIDEYGRELTDVEFRNIVKSTQRDKFDTYCENIDGYPFLEEDFC